MDIKTVENIKSILLSRRQALLERLYYLEHDLQKPEEQPLEQLEKANVETSTLVKIRMDERCAREFEAIEQALERIADSSFGTCSVCRKPISLKRLRIIPETTVCRYCALRIENPSRRLELH